MRINMRKRLLGLMATVVLVFSLFGLAGNALAATTTETAGGWTAEEVDGRKDVVRFGESVTIPKGKKISGALTVFGGNARVLGDVEEAVVVFGGNLDLAGRVGEDVVVFGGIVDLEPTADIEGDLVNFGGKVNKTEGARVGGNEVFGPNINIFGSRMGDIFSGWFWFLQGTLVLIGTLALGALIVSLLPTETARIAATIESEVWRSLGVGVLCIIAIPFVIVALVLTIIGIPLIPFFILALPLVFLYAYIGAGRLVGRKILEMLKGAQDSPVLEVLVGVLVLGLVGFVPFIGDILRGVALVLGIGAVMTTKFGTGRPWRRPRTVAVEGAGSLPTGGERPAAG